MEITIKELVDAKIKFATLEDDALIQLEIEKDGIRRVVEIAPKLELQKVVLGIQIK